MWIIIEEVKNFKNHDINLMANLAHKTKTEKVKYKLVWIKRILVLLCQDDINKMIFHMAEKEFRNNLTDLISNIFEDETTFDKFIDKLNDSLALLQEKFDFILKIPTTKSSIKREVANKSWIGKEYAPIYMLHFIYKNKELFNSDASKRELERKIKEYKVRPIDIIGFMVQKPISAGGYYKWLNFIVKESHKMFFDSNKNSVETLVENIVIQTQSDATFNKLTKLIAFWLVSDDLKKINNKVEYYEADHIIPKKYCEQNAIKEFSNLGNIDILSNNDNQDKNSQLTTDYLSASYINKKYKYDYNDVWSKIENWRNSNRINKVEFEDFIAHRTNFLKKVIKDKIIEETNAK